MTLIPCPACGSPEPRRIGAIPVASSFAGNPMEGFAADLAVCRTCGLGFRSPQPPQDVLARLYEAGSGTAWSEATTDRRDWEIAAEMVARVSAANVLDVGCFDGAFLDSLPPGVERVGIEINVDAAATAKGRGVRIAAEDLFDASLGEERFDLVAAFDVIEHVHDPRAFLGTMAGLVRPGGHLLFATGNLDARTWKLMGSRYLYCWFQEHIAFVSPRWTLAEAARHGLEVVDIVRFGHGPQGARAFLAGAVKNLLYKLAPGLIARLRRAGVAPDVALPPPAWTGARDHFVALLRVKS